MLPGYAWRTYCASGENGGRKRIVDVYEDRGSSSSLDIRLAKVADALQGCWHCGLEGAGARVGKPEERCEKEQLLPAVIDMRDDDWTADGAAALEQAVGWPGNALVIVAEAIGVERFIANHEVGIAVELLGAALGGLLDDALGQSGVRCEVVGDHADFGERVRIGKHRGLMPCSALDRDCHPAARRCCRLLRR